MSAAETALRVISWSMRPEGPPPPGDLRMATDLVRPSSDLTGALGRLTAYTAARLHLDDPTLGDPTPLGTGALVMAAAIGCIPQRRLAEAALTVVPRSTAPVEWIARHGVAAPALPHLPAELADEYRLLSPLTALFDRPVGLPGEGGVYQDGDARAAASRLRGHPAGRRVLVTELAEPSTVSAVRRWRSVLLERWRPGSDADRQLVLDVYEATMVYHRERAVGQVRDAHGVIMDPALSADGERLLEASSVAQWWGPLWRLQRSHNSELRARRYLHYDYLEGLRLYQLYRQLTGIAA